MKKTSSATRLLASRPCNQLRDPVDVVPHHLSQLNHEIQKHPPILAKLMASPQLDSHKGSQVSSAANAASYVDGACRRVAVGIKVAFFLPTLVGALNVEQPLTEIVDEFGWWMAELFVAESRETDADVRS